MLFCPTCGNILLLEKGSGSNRYFCKTCPYIFNINKKIERIETFDDKKIVDLVYGGKDAYKDAATTESICPKCGHNRALFKEIQIRSADEPTTIFYKCVNCGKEYKEG